MTLHAFDTTVNRIAGEEVTVTVPIYSTEPGTVTASAPGCTFPDGETVVIAGTRTYSLDNLRGGEGAAFGGAAGNAWANYSNYAYFLKIDQLALSELIESNFVSRAITLMASISGTAGGYNGHNFGIWFQNFNNSITWITRRPAYKGGTIAGAKATQRYIYYAVKHDTATSKLRHITTANNGTIQEVATVGTSTPAAGQNYLLIKHCAELYILPVAQATDQKMIDWAQTGAAPSGYEEHFTFTEEGSIVYGEVSQQSVEYPVRVDTLNYSTATIPGSTRRYTDAPGDPVVPASSIRVTIPAAVASPVTLTLTRPRAGVPARASESERIETASGVITLVDPATVVQAGPSQQYEVYL